MSTRKIVPTIGRVVLVWPRVAMRGPLPWCGLIADVMPGPSEADPYHITVGGVSNSGNHVAFQNIPLLELAEGEGAPDHAFACWMPFQLGQAGKTDLVASQLAVKVDRLSKLLVSVLAGHPFFLEDLTDLDTGVPVPEFCAPKRPSAVSEVPAHESTPVDSAPVGEACPAEGDPLGTLAQQDGRSIDGAAAAELPADPDSTVATADVDQDLSCESIEGSVRSDSAAS